jgi:arylsulfatase A
MDRRGFLQTASAALLGATAGESAPSRPPNIVLIYADDLGFGDLGCYGGPISTPNLDSLARDGMRFTHFHSANPVCSPSRAALLTGRYPTRVSVPRVLFPADKVGLPDDEMTIAQMLKGRNYKTMCVGKWHLGHLPQYLPTNRGFDEYFGIPYSNDMNPRVLLHNTEVVEQQATLETLTPRYTQSAVRFIEGAKDSPFFLYMPHTYPHIPLAASDRFRGKSPQGIYGDVIAEMDWSVGEILRVLKKYGLQNNTLVMFSSDNGPWYQGSAGKLRGRKGMTWEGGVRVPLLARMPGRIPKDRIATAVTSTMDMLPTIAGLCGASKPGKPLDGIDMWPVLSGERNELQREALLYFDGWNLQCARLDRWKLHVARYNNVTYSPAPAGGRRNLPIRPELYDVVSDPDESYDVAAENPQVVADMVARIERLIPTFPDEVKKAWAEVRSQKPSPSSTGAVSRQAK